PRLTLFQTLSALPAPQFEQLRFTLNPPPGFLPEGVAAQGNRVAALLSWVEAATGCGLEQLYMVLEQLCPGWRDEEVESDEKGLPWMVPYGRNPYFTGRDEVLTALYQQLNEGGTAAISQTQAISGLGGIGKTQTAVEYAYRYRDDYRYVLWVRADTELELTNSYVSIAQTLNLPLKDAENQDETVQYVRLWLSREEGWLLIFDNADRPEIVQPFLPREFKGHILVTSRAQDFQDLGIVQPVAMETLSAEDAIAFLLNRTGRTNLVGANDIHPMRGIEQSAELQATTDLAAELGYLPLALEQAAAYIVANRVPFTDYLKSYRKQRLKRLEKAKPKLGNYPDSIATTWALNLKEVQKIAPAAAALLNYCAFLHPNAIPFSLFTQGAAELGEPLATALANADDDLLELYDLLNPLGSYSLIRVGPESQSLSLHSMVQEVIRLELGDAGCQTWVEPLLKATKEVIPAKVENLDYQDWPILALLANHVQELANHYQQSEIASIEAADVFHVTGAYLLERGEYVLADPLLQKAMELRRSLFGDEHEDIATSLNQAAISLKLQGRYGEAELLYQEALAMRKRLLGNEHSDVAQSLNNLAVLYYNQSRYGKAEPLYQEALTMRKRLLGNEHSNVAQSLNNLAGLYYSQGCYGEAEPLYQEALAMRKRLLGEVHPDIATSINDLAVLYKTQGRYEEAEPLYKKALTMYKRLLGEAHPFVAISINNLAALYKTQGRYEEAEPLFQAALVLQKQLLGEAHPFTAAGLSNLATLYKTQGRYEEAELLYKEALAIYKRLLGKVHPDIATILNNLASLCLDQGRYGEAELYLTEALQLFRQLLGDDHPNVGRVTDNLGILYTTQGRTEEARSLYQQALAILEPKLGDQHPWTVRCRENLAKVENGEQ
ncbi:tetratricopeptide repeat protein, partial [filamentous cyanobacterium CCP4]